jgi:myo-inositol 2-dehydrogenase/D-chiro-inositol 1-dehydrogenase
MDVTNKFRVGVIGAGRIGVVHARTMSRIPGFEVLAVADPVVAAAQRLAAELGIPKATADYREILADPAIDAVLVCSSTDTHADIVIEAAAAGKHIFCEKPVDLSLEKVDRALAAVAAAGVTFQVGFNRRFDPDFKRIRDLLAAGTLGAPHLLRIASRDPNPPSPAYAAVSGGMFLDMTIHDFDMARYLMGCEVEEIYVAAAVLVDPAIGAAGDVDTALITLRFENGALGTIDNSRKAVFGYDQRVEVLGSKGMAANRNHGPDTVVVSGAAHIEESLPLNFFMERYVPSFEAEIRAFADAVSTGTTPPVGGEDGRQALLLGLAAKRSWKENRPVRLAEVDPRRA